MSPLGNGGCPAASAAPKTKHTRSEMETVFMAPGLRANGERPKVIKYRYCVLPQRFSCCENFGRNPGPDKSHILLNIRIFIRIIDFHKPGVTQSLRRPIR